MKSLAAEKRDLAIEMILVTGEVTESCNCGLLYPFFGRMSV
jgi:hypothetical protein